MDKDRRSVLRMTTLTVGGLVAGCTAVSSNPTGTDQSINRTPELPDSSSTYPVSEGELNILAYDRQGTYETIKLGDRSDLTEGVEYVTSEDGSESATKEFLPSPHKIVIYDFLGVSQINVMIFDIAAEHIIYNASHEIPNNKSLIFRLLTPSKYVVRVDLHETRHTLRIPCDFFDCNTSATRIGILEDVLGDTQIKSSVISSNAGCADYTC